MTGGGAPAGYEPVTAPHAQGMAARGVADAVRTALAGGATLHGWAGAQPARRAMTGRETAWAVALGAEAVVVRHSRHGGLLAPLTGDLFRAPTRAPTELANALRLGQAGVPTPAVLAYATYPAPLGFARADVVTREVPASEDLLGVLARAEVAERREVTWPAVALLLRALAAAGARHPDLNAKNILLTRAGAGAPTTAWVLDTDVVAFERPGSRAVALANAARLVRSLEKRAATFRAPLAAGELDGLRATAEAFA